MKKQAYVTAAIFVLVLLAFSPAKAQGNNDHLTANIPFDFNVRGKSLPAGEYIVSVLNPTSAGTVLQISRKRGRGLVVVQTIGVTGTKREDATLIFRRYGNQYFLAQAWMPADSNGLSISKSKAEREIERNLSLSNVRPSTIAISLKR
jgi:hypothetical protein